MVKKQRNSQIERLRIVSMLMIIAHHYVLYGVMQSYNVSVANQIYNAGTLLNKVISAFMLPGGVVGVAIFFIIAGYFGIESDAVRIRNIIEITYFYAWLGVGLRFIASRLGFVESLASRVFLGDLFPISTELYWFSSAYIMIMLMKPVLNRYIRLETLEQSMIRICIVLFVYSILRTVNAHYLGIVNGIIYYYVGG